MTGDWSGAEHREPEKPIEANEAATEAARKKQEAEEERAKKELKAHEVMKNKKQQLDMTQLAKAAGDDAEIKKLEAKKRIYDAYMRGTKLARDGEGELLLAKILKHSVCSMRKPRSRLS